MFHSINSSGAVNKFVRDGKASISVIAAASIMVVASMSALTLEFGRLYLEKRRQQTATDLAAIAAAAYPSDPRRAAAIILKRNGIDPESMTSLKLGVYLARESLPVDERFSQVSKDGLPAAELTLKRQIPFIFARLIEKSFGSSFVNISTRAVGASNAEAAFSIGSKLASLEDGIANSLLSAMLGTNVSLSVMDYNALASANVKLFGFFDSLATRASLKALTYHELLTRKFDLPTVFGAMSDTGGLGPTALAALSQLAAATSGRPIRIDFKDWMSVGSFGTRLVGTPGHGDPTVNALELLSTTARIASAGKLIRLDLTSNLPTGTAISLALAIGEPKQYSGFVSVGAPNAIVETAQTRLLLQIRQSVAGLPDLLKLPLYVEAASGQARLTATSCANGKTASLAVRPSLVSLRIAEIDEKDMSQFNKAVLSEPAVLVRTPLIKVSAFGFIEMSNTKDRVVDFSSGDIDASSVKTVATEESLATLMGSLLDKTDIQANGLSLLGAISGSSLKSTIVAIVPALDKVLMTVLTLAGVKVGAVDVQVQGVRCNNASLVR